MTQINRDEWLRALSEAGLHRESDAEAITIQEFAEMFGVTRTTATYRMNALVAAGKARETSKRQLTPYGRLITYKAYRLET